jgi:hypothetical protein
MSSEVDDDADKPTHEGEIGIEHLFQIPCLYATHVIQNNAQATNERKYKRISGECGESTPT